MIVVGRQAAGHKQAFKNKLLDGELEELRVGCAKFNRGESSDFRSAAGLPTIYQVGNFSAFRGLYELIYFLLLFPLNFLSKSSAIAFGSLYFIYGSSSKRGVEVCKT